MVEPPRLEAKYRLCEMVGQLVTCPSPDCNEADHEHLDNMASHVVIPVETGIQDVEEENWIPACAGMTTIETKER